MKWIVLWTIVWFVQKPYEVPESKYGENNSIVCVPSVFISEQKSEQRYKVFTSSSELSEFVDNMPRKTEGLNSSYCKDIEIYEFKEAK